MCLYGTLLNIAKRRNWFQSPTSKLMVNTSHAFCCPLMSNTLLPAAQIILPRSGKLRIWRRWFLSLAKQLRNRRLLSSRAPWQAISAGSGTVLSVLILPTSLPLVQITMHVCGSSIVRPSFANTMVTTEVWISILTHLITKLTLSGLVCVALNDYSEAR